MTDSDRADYADDANSYRKRRRRRLEEEQCRRSTQQREDPDAHDAAGT